MCGKNCGGNGSEVTTIEALFLHDVEGRGAISFATTIGRRGTSEHHYLYVLRPYPPTVIDLISGLSVIQDKLIHDLIDYSLNRLIKVFNPRIIHCRR